MHADLFRLLALPQTVAKKS